MDTNREKIFIAPSVLSADFSNMGKEVERLTASGADMIHCDVMDGHFVPNITFGTKFVKDLRRHTRLPLDVHLMISEPAKYVDKFIEAGADCLTFHYETGCDISAVLKTIKSAGVKCGLAVSPDTPVESVKDYIDMCDLILLMSVYPGFGGQKFIERSYERLLKLKEIISEAASKTLIEIDGGVNEENASRIKACGANILVAGNALFAASDIKTAILTLREA